MTIGVDLGGTNIRAGIKLGNQITQRQHTRLENPSSFDRTMDQLIDTIQPLLTKSIRGIGVAVPSVVDKKNGIVYNVVNIPSWVKVDLKDILEKKFQVPVSVDNDANCFALGEYLFGEAIGYNPVVGLAIGTGLGTGIVIDGNVYTGRNCGAGEIGYLPYLDKDLESYCSSGFFSAVHNTSALLAFEHATNGDQHAIRIWKEFGKHLGHALKAVVYAYDPGIIVLGGSISKAYRFFSNEMHETLKTSFHFPESLKHLKIVASTNDNITLLGAGGLMGA